MKYAALIVTYNRKALLEKCLHSLQKQTHSLSAIIIIDNASTDGTESWFKESVFSKLNTFTYIRLEKNTGGAGGFSTGLQYALNHGYDWCWIMDDDAEPSFNALEKLIDVRPLPENIYGSIATNGDYTAWHTTLITPQGNITTNKLNDIPALSEVTFLPFLGVLIHSSVIKNIGLPDEGFFIAGDDLEYCLRAKAAGYKIMVVGDSKINHPKADIYLLSFFGKEIQYLRLPAWKNYYNTRNKILISKKYYGFKLFTETLPGILFRACMNIHNNPKKALQIYSTIAGILDGLIGLKGKRHSWWKIPQ